MSNITMKIERMKSVQMHEISELLAKYWKDRGMPEYDKTWAADYLKHGHAKEIEKEEFFACVEGGRVIGCVSLITDVSGVAEIRDMVIKKECRGEGYGKQLLDDIIKIAKERNLRKIFALVLPQAESLYAKAGFEKEGILKSHFKDGENLSIMSLFLRG